MQSHGIPTLNDDEIEMNIKLQKHISLDNLIPNIILFKSFDKEWTEDMIFSTFIEHSINFQNILDQSFRSL